MFDDTICAVATPAGCGGVAVIRVSGPSAIDICSRLSGLSLDSVSPNTARYGRFLQADGQVLDDVVYTIFRAPHSYTGEDTVEVSCHGSVYIQNRVIETLTDAGCRLARRGEFTQRAFLHGKMDLSQAEAVADLIASDSEASRRLALKQLRGGISNDLKSLREQLLKISSLLELELDFSEEDVTFASREELKELASRIENRLQQLTESFRRGNAIKNGIPVAIVGETNAGKSTLLNLLLHEEKAIVSDVHGTTRDSIEDCIDIEGIKFRFIDTAGLRDTSDTVEQLGIERTYQKIEQAAIVLWVIDDTQICDHIETMASRILPRCEGKQLLLVFNKRDRISAEEAAVIDNLFSHISAERLHISAKLHDNTDRLEQMLLSLAGVEQSSNDDIIITNLRHYEALSAALTAIRRVQKGLSENLSGDLVAIDLHDVLNHIGEVTGSITTDEILGNIFSHFCIGK